MENLNDFNKFVKEEYMYRQSADTKPERHEKSKQYFIKQLISHGFKEKDLNNLEIDALGKLLSDVKKRKNNG